MRKKSAWYFWSLITLAVAALVITQLATHQQPGGVLQKNLIVFLWADVALAVLMLLTVGVMTLRLWRDHRQDKRGARLSLRLTMVLLVMSLTPAILLYAVSANSVFRSIESWFDTPLGRAFEQGIGFGQDVIGVEFSQLDGVVRDIARNLNRQQGALPFWIDDLSRYHRLQGIYVYGGDGNLILSGGESADTGYLSAPMITQLAQSGKIYNVIRREHFINLEVILAVSGIRDVGAIAAVRQLPAQITDSITEIEQGRQAYENLKVLRKGLRWSFLITLSLSLVLILLIVCWICIGLGRRLASPLVRLSSAAAAVGAGDLSRRLHGENDIKEISQINRSFNAMVAELSERQQAMRQFTAYLQNLLEAVPVGILTFSSHGELTLCNTEIKKLFNYDFSSGQNLTALSRESAVAMLTDTVREHTAHGEGVISESRIQGARGMVILLRVITLSAGAGGGLLVVSSDITKQIQAARGAAWEEASRRLAHEIKNPLTPIQLAAERLQRKLTDKLGSDDAEILNRLVETIVNQVGAMRLMIDDFRDYASERRMTAQAVDINALIGDVARLYEGSNINLELNLGAALPAVNGDAVRLRQMLHNLLVNAGDAVAEHAAPAIRIATAVDGAGNEVMLEIADNGGGIREDILHTVCEPYMTTKPDGSGLGLAVVQKTVEEHQGGLNIENTADGLRVRVHLPVWQNADN